MEKLELWFSRVSAASSVKDVLDIVRDFLASWTPLDIARLPAGARPQGRFVDTEDVASYALRVKLQQFSDGPGVDRMAAFFGCAAEQLSKITRASGQPAAD